MVSGNARTKPVRIFVTGANQWREYDRWPPTTYEQEYFLSEGGALAESVGKGESTFKYDPADPTPVLGGRLMNPSHAGVKDNRTLEARNDVITFTSPSFARDLDLIGAPTLDLAVSVDNPNARLRSAVRRQHPR
jgi:predicted acyl esterase